MGEFYLYAYESKDKAMKEMKMYHREYFSYYKERFPRTKSGQTIVAHRGKKRVQVKITEPNSLGGDTVSGNISGKNVVCFFYRGTWTVIN